MIKRIIPISSGKGGVGKTSFAINLALSLARHGRTILVDLDTGTSSVRNTIEAPVRRDLYHFLEKEAPLASCITPLPTSLDREGRFRNFGFIAAPKHLIESIANMHPKTRNRIIDGVNRLEANFVILDLKAGLDTGVIDFMPHANTGILVFTPNHPAATLAASDVAKAILFRELRELFYEKSGIYAHFRGIDSREINRLIDLTEDVYVADPANLDNFLEILKNRLPRHSFVTILRHVVQRFRVFYVLNRFNGVESSYQTAVQPLVENITRHVSARIGITNLGWVIDSEAYHRANDTGVPYLLTPEREPEKQRDEVERKMAPLYELAGLSPRRDKGAATVSDPPTRESVLDSQLRALQGLYQSKRVETVRQNFDYIVSCLRYVFANRRASELGTPRLLKRGELVPLLLAQKLRREAAQRAQ